jgi:outer membrane receptor protein involved in Fe transport
MTPTSRILTITFFLLISISCLAQKGSIGGYISDAESNIPLNGVSVNIDGGKGDNSDIFGKFTIPSVDPGQYEMIVSHIGYKTQFIPVDVKPNLHSIVHVNLKRSDLQLSEVRINSKKNNGLNTISAVDIRLRPINTSQDVLRIVPGLFIAQHQGGGKAEQIFLRGYDLDHGTDIAITVDGIPVNMVSHAHGQGYADLHFLIPETVEKVDFNKGPYFADKGNLATTAYVDFSTRDFIDKNFIKTEIGQFNTKRVAGLLKLLNKSTEKSRQQVYVAGEYAKTNSYFDSPQDFHRINLMGKYSAWFGNTSQLTIIASTFGSKWNASGQIPDRAVKEGIISKFGSIDNTEGGNTARSNFSIKFSKQLNNDWKTTQQIYFTHYRFNLYSDFTFFLKDSINGDMINQREARNLLGYSGKISRAYLLGNKKITTEFGTGFRYDDIGDIALSKANRTTFFYDIRHGAIKEMNAFMYANNEIELSDRFTLNAGVRYDRLSFNYKNKLTTSGFQNVDKGTVSPKLNLSYIPNQKLKLYVENGIGFHSNDTRVILSEQVNAILPKVFGTDLGIIIKPNSNLIIKMALWYLYSQQEFVYAGDDGVVEPSGKARRAGIDASVRYQLTKWLYGDWDINFAHARMIGEQKGKDYVPLAPTFTSIGGLTAKTKKGFSSSLRYRFMDRRPANETNTIIADGYFLLDMITAWRWRNFECMVSMENILDTYWREAQFDTRSRLKTETVPVEEIHYTPGTPRFIKAGISFYF